MTFYLIASVIFVTAVIISDIFAVEISMTLTLIFKISQGHIRRAARILEGRGPESGSQQQKGVRECHPGKFWKTYRRFYALYCICCTQIVNLANFKVRHNLKLKVLYLKYIKEKSDTTKINIIGTISEIYKK